MKLSDSQIKHVLDSLDSQYGHLRGLRSIRSNHEGDSTHFIITVESLADLDTPAKHRMDHLEVDLRWEEGPEIVLHIYRCRSGAAGAEEWPKSLHPAMGGDPIGHVDLGGYGTLAFTAQRIAIRNGRSCDVRNCCFSNNHVLALWDRAAVGDRIRGGGHENFATLACWLPVLGTARPNDTALGTLVDETHTSYLEIRNIGFLRGVSRPSTGQFIQKSGARTGVTTGEMLGFANIHVNERYFKHVGVESVGFTCPGDSGSAVLDRQMNLIGVHFAGEDVECGRGRGFFIPTEPDSLTESDGSVIGIHIG